MTIQSDAHSKALSLNLECSVYGTFAEIGAGQEVARWFLSVGAASGTVAKTISAYDKKVSDEIYGAGTRHVSRERLVAMLDWEFSLLLERLGSTRGKEARFFVFADTVATRNFQGTNEPNGWVGIRFQTEPGAEPSQMLLHINLCDSTAQLQQMAIGILGVNLVFAAFHQLSDIDTFLAGLFDELSTARIEIDVIEVTGPAFANQDSSQWCLSLLSRGMAHAIIFQSDGTVVEPSSVLRKRPVLVIRGTLSHPEFLDDHLFQSANGQLFAEGVACERAPVTLFEMSIRHVSRVETISASEMLKCVRQLTHAGPIAVTDFPETYLLSRYLQRYSTEPVRFVLSIAAAAKTLHEAFYQDLPGTLLEGLGRLLATNVKLYVAPMPREVFLAALKDLSTTLAVRDSGTGFVTLDDLIPTVPARHLVDYLRATGRMVALK
jgi:hypothetical protein